MVRYDTSGGLFVSKGDAIQRCRESLFNGRGPMFKAQTDCLAVAIVY